MTAENDRAVVVSFDLDDTLMDHESAVVSGARQFYADHRNVFDLFFTLPCYCPPGQLHHHDSSRARRWPLP